MAEGDKGRGERSGNPANGPANAHERVATGPAYPPRAMRAEQSADYLSMSRSMFLKLVDEGKMPKPLKVGTMAMWDRYDIDHAFEDLKRDKGEPKPGENTMHKLLGIKP